MAVDLLEVAKLCAAVVIVAGTLAGTLALLAFAALVVKTAIGDKEK